MIYTYEQCSGKLFDGSGEFIGVGYAGGNCGKNPEGVNNPAMQEMRSVGPLPQGLYSLGAVVEGSHLGVFAIPLMPDPANEMFGRSAFYCHGDNKLGNQSASEGCIIMPPSIRRMIYAGIDSKIRVVAKKK